MKHRIPFSFTLSIIVVFISSFVGPPAILANASDSGTWTLRLPPDAPIERSHHAMAYDSVRDVTVMFGGLSRIAGALNDTWELSGNTWIQRTPDHAPSRRYAHGMAYDAARQQVVLFGGDAAGETWIWDGSDWTQKTPPTSPSGRAHPALAFDAARRVVVMYGGGPADTWEWDGISWMERHPIHHPETGSGIALSMAYDVARSRVVLVDIASGQTWEYDGSDWVDRDPPFTPTQTSRAAMVYDETINRIVMFPMESPNSDFIDLVWEWDGTIWTERTLIGGPDIRAVTTAVYDDNRAKIVMFGGVSSGKAFKDTWEWDGVSGAWSQTIPTNPPAGHSRIAYDATRGEIVLFGGNTSTSGGTSAHSETWTLGDSDTRWTRRFPQHHPPARQDTALVYDSGRSVVVVFGGVYGGDLYNDTWEWNGTDWVQRQPTVAPPPRWSNAMTYDAIRGVVVLFGGRSDSGIVGDTWEYDGTNWVQRFPQHTPPPMAGAELAFDSRRNRSVLFGAVVIQGFYSPETWEWDGVDWTQRMLPQLPPGRERHAMAYDPSRGVTVLYGGIGPHFMGDIWEYDGNTWTQAFPQVTPGLRLTTMVYNAHRRAVAIFGGWGGPDDVWEYQGPTTNNPPTVNAGGSYTVTEGGVVVVTAFGNDPEEGTLAYEWDLDNDGTFETPGQSVNFSASGLSAPSSHIITMRVTDDGGLTATDQASVFVHYSFSGFFPPVDNLPTLNVVKGGAAVSVKFSLGKNQGLNIFASGYPISQKIACDSGAPWDDIEQTVNAGGSSLNYDAATNTYSYTWKTEKTWAGTCRQLIIKLSDGSEHKANFRFK